MKHIIERLGTQEINRLRLGISRPPGRMDPAAWVLTPLKGDDAILAALVIDRAVAAVETWLTEGIEIAMTRCNGVVGEDAKPEKRKATPPPNPLPVNGEGE
jgi:PTH1 family peptidyl-tRNA hydrolase